MQALAPWHLVGVRGRLDRPFWGWMASWSALCGALASNRLQWTAEALLTLALVLLLVELAWGSLWDLATGTDWFRSLAHDWSTARPASLPVPPYTQPDSPGGRLWRWLSRVVGWWQGAFWPSAGPALLGLAAAAILTVVLGVLLPSRMRPLHAALAALVGLGVAQRHRGRTPLLSGALVQAGLSWLAGHVALTGLQMPSLLLAVAYAIATWGALQIAEGRMIGLWSLNGGQAIGVVVLVVLRQPLAAGLVALLLFGQVVIQPLLRFEGNQGGTVPSGRMWPWLMAAMLIAALALQ